jgi:hypothetical protein
MKLAIIKKWNTSFGYYDVEQNSVTNELDINKCKQYLKKKNFIIYSQSNCNYSRNINEVFLDFLEIYKTLNNSRSVLLNSVIGRYDIKIVKEYTFLERSFCNINYSFENFIAKCKKYYSQKLNYHKQIKSPKLILNRQIYGKQFKFKFNNANSA